MGPVVSTMRDKKWFWMSYGSNIGLKVRKEIGIFPLQGKTLCSEEAAGGVQVNPRPNAVVICTDFALPCRRDALV